MLLGSEETMNILIILHDTSIELTVFLVADAVTCANGNSNKKEAP